MPTRNTYATRQTPLKASQTKSIPHPEKDTNRTFSSSQLQNQISTFSRIYNQTTAQNVRHSSLRVPNLPPLRRPRRDGRVRQSLQLGSVRPDVANHLLTRALSRL